MLLPEPYESLFDDAERGRQGVVLEFAKGPAKTMMTIIEARSGKKVEYESEEATKRLGS